MIETRDDTWHTIKYQQIPQTQRVGKERESLMREAGDTNINFKSRGGVKRWKKNGTNKKCQQEKKGRIGHFIY